MMAALERGGEDEIRRIREEAEAEVARLGEEIRARLDGRRASERARLQERLRGETELCLSAARLEGRHRVLAARDGMLERVLEAVRTRLPPALVDPRYSVALPDALEWALGFVPEGGVVLCSPEIARVMRDGSHGRADLEVRPGLDTGTGFILVSADDSIRVDGTLEARLTAAWPELAMRIADLVEKGAR